MKHILSAILVASLMVAAVGSAEGAGNRKAATKSRVNKALPAAVTPARAAAKKPVDTSMIKEGPGREVFLEKCVDCHELTDVISKRKNRDAWELKVREMIAFGAKLSPDQISTITNFLVDHYGL